MFDFYDVLVNGVKLGVYEAETGFNAAMQALKDEGYNGLTDWRADNPNSTLDAVKSNYTGRRVG